MTSLNVKGLNVPEKLKMLLSDLKHSNTDVGFVQETNFKAGNLSILQNRFFPCVYHAPNQEAKTKGASILISSRIPWSLTDKFLDTGRRYLFLKGHIGSVKVTLATIYAPNAHQDSCLAKVLSRLMEFMEGKLIMGGDLNVPLDPKIDTSTGVSSVSSKTRKRILRKFHELQLVDT